MRPLGEGFARFQQMRGYPVVEAFGRYWYSYARRCYLSIPHQATLDVEPSEVAAKFRGFGALVARYPSCTLPGVPAGIYACRQRDYSLGTVSPRLRSYVRKGLERLELRVIDADQLAAGGLQCNLDTMKRHRRWDPEFGEAARWCRLARIVGDCPEFDAIGAFVDGTLATYTIRYRAHGWVHALYRNSRAGLDEHRAPHTLLYWMLREAMADPAVEAVGDSPVAMHPEGSLHEWKLRMGYRTEPYNNVFALHPALRPVLASFAGPALLRLARRIRPSNALIERAELVVATAFAHRRTCPGVALAAETARRS